MSFKTRKRKSSPCEFLMTPLEEAIHYVKRGDDKSGFHVKYIDKDIGHGTFAKEDFSQGQYLLEYKGELIDRKEGEKRERLYPQSVGSFLYFFRHTYCVDATYTDGDAKMVNDLPASYAIAQMRVVEVDNIPHLCLFAIKDIHKGEELQYDYGITTLPWRKRLKKNETSSGQIDLEDLTFCGLFKRCKKNETSQLQCTQVEMKPTTSQKKQRKSKKVFKRYPSFLMGDDDSNDDDFICGSSSDESEDYEIKDELLPWL